MIRAHDVPPGTDRCVHCGALKPDSYGSTCVPRHGESEPVKDQPRRIAAIYDIDTIHSRLGELRQEKKDALNTVDEGQAG